MADTGFLVGAYASLPPTRPEQADYYRALAEQPWVTGLELPYPGDLAEDVAWISGNLHAGWNTNSVTLIPGTMQNVWRNSGFGLASPDEDGRVAALSFAEDVRRRVTTSPTPWATAAWRSSGSLRPTGRASRDAFARSLEELVAGDWAGARLVIEHCDRLIGGAHQRRVPVPGGRDLGGARHRGRDPHQLGTLLPGGGDPEAPNGIRQAAESGVLTGVVFSGASDSHHLRRRMGRRARPGPVGRACVADDLRADRELRGGREAGPGTRLPGCEDLRARGVHHRRADRDDPRDTPRGVRSVTAPAADLRLVTRLPARWPHQAFRPPCGGCR